MSLTDSTMMPLGKKAPEFSLPDTVSGQTISFADVAGEKGTVVMFICNHCPYVLHIIDEIELGDSNTELMAGEIKRRYKKRPVVVYPDPSGRARKTSAPVGRTDFALLSYAGFDVRAPRHASPVVDRINTVQAALKTTDGRRRLFINRNCKNLIRALDGLTYLNNQPDKSGGLDHITDALGYLIMGEMPLRKNIEPRQPTRWS